MEQPLVLLVEADLMAKARLGDTVRRLDREMRTTTTAGLVEALLDSDPQILVLDLDNGAEKLLSELKKARAAGITPKRVIGYYSHVDVELGDAARAAGCEPIPRGRFWRALNEILSAG
ncbi:MAG TPA: hypothetical protein VHJ82_06080 [Actinomycetota bacterium]|nr:hypothetical protein [Actinomycetota bacterium]